ncbi:uncharacterized protein LOC143201683 [Rhynchophorus ferrugineus]|uniref:uncharacterized protein LOC143201683 n=1 Tax=Rhynchophorus ferrugineus TaxID=354439 RepID=UPI003FCEDE33
MTVLILYLVVVPCAVFGAEWPVPASIKCNSAGTFQCNAPGKYEDPFDSSCKTFYVCGMENDQLIQNKGLCQGNTSYDPVKEVCSPSYKCQCDEDSDSDWQISPNLCDHCSQCMDDSNVTTTPSDTDITTESSATSTSSYCSVGGIFSCTDTGRYPNPNDSTCRSYYYCYYWQSVNRLKWYFYNCSVGYFNPNTGSCDLNYKCPCSSTTDEVSTSSPTTLFMVSSTVTIDAGTTTDTLPVTTTDISITTVSSIFNCTDTGRYPNTADLSCKSYYYCYNWQSIGEFRWYLYNCSAGLFNPNTGSCDPNYKCPCFSTTESPTTSGTTDSSTTSIDIGTTTNSSPITTTDAVSTTTSSPATSTSSPLYCAIGGVFNCTDTGRYPNPADLTCRSYYYCYNWQSTGQLRWYPYNCSVGLFNPSSGSCDRNYKCPCSSTTEGPTITGTTDSSTTSIDIGATTNSSPITTTEAVATTTSSPATSTSSTLYCAVGGVFNCTDTGRYPNPADLTCRSYYYCYNWQSTGQLRWYPYNCSVGLFNPSSGSCDQNYKCPCTSTTEGSTTSGTTDSSTTSIDIGTTTNSSPITTTEAVATTTSSPATSTSSPLYCAVGGVFNCTDTGRYPNPADLTCRSYYYCYNWQSTGQLRWYPYNCSVGLFNPSTGSCDRNYKCPCSSTTEGPTTSGTTDSSTTSIDIGTTTNSSPITTTEAVATTTSSPATSTSSTLYCAIGGVFNCTDTGRYPNPADLTCRSYYYCYNWQSTGQLRWYPYNCSVGLFNPSTGSCDRNYKCPCSSTTKGPTTSGTTDSSTTSIDIGTTTNSSPITTTEAVATTTSSPATSTSSTLYCAIGGVFNCTDTGRYPNPADLTCRSYYYCYNWQSTGQLRWYPYNCSVGLFNPSTGSCDRNYKCPCSSTTEGPTTSGTTDSSTTSIDIGTTTNSSPITTTEAVATTTSSPATSTSSTSYCAVGGVFNCTDTGRYPNPADLTCRSYYYCYNWQSTGQLRWYPYNCSVGLFNPSSGSCDQNYKCPCFSTTESPTTSGTTDSSTTSIDIGATTNSSPITTTEAVATTTSSPATSTSSTLYCAVGGVFNCTDTGRYPNPADLTCRSYYYCYNWQSTGQLKWYPYNCSVGLFNPSTGSCDRNYKCPCSSTTESPTTSGTTDSSTTSIDIGTTTNSSPITTTEAVATTTSSPATSTSSTLYCAVGGVFNCTDTGRYPNPADLTCRSYYYCYNWQSTGQLRWYPYNCSVGLFNPSSGSCDQNYKCPCFSTTESPTTSGTTDSSTTSIDIGATTNSSPITTTEAVATTTSSPATSTSSTLYCAVGGVFNCTDTGRYPNPADLTCRSYYYCYNWQSTGQLRWYPYNCSVGLFNPSSGSCDRNYKCPCSSTTESPTTSGTTDSSTTSIDIRTTTNSSPITTTEAVATTTSSPATSTSSTLYCAVGGVFNCTDTGRYPNPADLTCRSYYYCYNWQSTGQLKWYPYNCSVGLFNPSTGSCDRNYKCPCSSTTESPTTSGTTDSSTTSINIGTTTNSSPITTTEAVATTTSSPATSTSSTLYCAVGGVFNCTDTGRYPNPADLTCRSYYYCYNWQSTGQLKWYPYNCSVGLFNPSTGSCDRNYKCPCSSTTEGPTTSGTTDSSTTSIDIGTTTNSSPITTTEAVATTTSSPATSTSSTLYCAVGGVFNCTDTGRYPNPADLTCRSYYYCYNWQSTGQLRWYPYNCSVGLFNPSSGSCDRNYKCPCSSTTERPTTSGTTDSSTTSIDIGTTTNSSPITTTEAVATTTSSPATSTSSPLYCAVGGVFNCTDTGRYPNPADLTCRSYYYCYNWQSTGQLKWYPYNCSVGLFNPSTGSCDRNYNCPCSEIP